jgi:hypothetical protein
MAKPPAGQAVDAHGGPVVDPTKNVDALVESAVKRLDDLRGVTVASLRREMEMRADYEDKLRQSDEKLRLAESARIDAIRAVDVGAVNRAAEVQATQAGALASQVLATADAFRVSLAAALEPIQKDIRDLRDAQSRTVGGKDQSGDTRLNIGAILGGLSVLLVLVFGVSSLLIQLGK